MYEEQRMEKICREIVNRLQIDLSGLRILTEAASGMYAVTPLLAGLAGAKEVICLGKNSDYGSFTETTSTIKRMAKQWGVKEPIFISDRKDPILAGIDVITNLGMVRPLDKGLLELIGTQAVISYMCESWEFRKGDLDLEICEELQIPVMGTDEHADNVRVFDYSGMLAVKMVLEAGVEILGNRIAVMSSDPFSAPIVRALRQCGAYVQLFTINDEYLDIEKHNWDAVIVAEYIKDCTIMGENGILSGDRLATLLSKVFTVVQFAGSNDCKLIKQCSCTIYPDIQLTPIRMAKTFAYLGVTPVILLHAAGLLVGEKMARAKKMGLTGERFNSYVLKHSPAQTVF